MSDLTDALDRAQRAAAATDAALAAFVNLPALPVLPLVCLRCGEPLPADETCAVCQWHAEMGDGWYRENDRWDNEEGEA